MSAHRYWRINIASGVGSSLSLGEVEMFDSLFGTDICSGGTASASSEAWGSVAANAFDNNIVTWWHANTTTNEYIQYDLGLGNDKDIIQISIVCRAGIPDQAPETFTIQYSDNDSDWFDSWTETNITTWIDTLPFFFFASTYTGDPISWRINTSAIDGGNEFALAEVEFRATVGGTDLSVGGSGYASNSNGTYPPSNAFDKNASTFYTGGSEPAWLAYMLSTPAYIGEVMLQARPSAADQSCKDFTIEYSVDNINWTVQATVEGETGWTNGEVRTFSLAPVVITPVMNPTSGAYSSGQTVTITCSTPSSTIYYTTDGSTPTTGSSVYSTAIEITEGINIRAFATASDMDDSEIASETYTISADTVQPIIFIIT